MVQGAVDQHLLFSLLFLLLPFTSFPLHRQASSTCVTDAEIIASSVAKVKVECEAAGVPPEALLALWDDEGRPTATLLQLLR